MSQPDAAVVAAVALLYAAGAEVSWRWFGASAMGMAFYPPAGVTLAALVTVRRRLWAPVLAAAGCAEVAVNLLHGLDAPLALGYASANVVEPLVGAGLLRTRREVRVVGPRLDRRVPMLWLVACAMCAGPLAGAATGATVRWVEAGSAWWLSLLQWWAGDALGVLAIGAPLLVWLHVEPLSGRRVELVLAAVTAVVGSAVAFRVMPSVPTVVVLPVLLWGALRFGVRGVALLTPIVCVAANAAAATGVGPFSVVGLGSPSAQLGFTQLWLAVVVLTAWFVAVGIAERVGLEWSLARRELLAQREHEALAQLATLQEITAALAAAPTAADIARVLADAAGDLGAVSIDLDLRAPVDPDRPGALARRVRLPAAPSLRVPVGGDEQGAVLTATFAEQDEAEHARPLVATLASLADQALRRAAVADVEHTIAIELQRALLGRPDQVEFLEIGATYQASERHLEVGGDWYDVIATSTGPLLVVGDVVGHSLRAAAAMGHLRSATRVIASQTAHPGEILARLDRFADGLEDARLATVAAVAIDESDGSAVIASAGHPPPLLVTATGDATFIEGVTSPPLAAMPGIVRISARVPFAAGDQIVLYTDGLVERRDAPIDVGLRRLREAARRVRERPAEAQAAHLVSTLTGGHADDDIAVLVVRARPAGPRAVTGRRAAQLRTSPR